MLSWLDCCLKTAQSVVNGLIELVNPEPIQRALVGINCFAASDDKSDSAQEAATPTPVVTSADALLGKGDFQEKKFLDLRDTGFPPPDYEVACMMSRPLSVTPCDVPLPPSPPPADAAHHHLNEKMYLDLSCYFTPVDDKVPDLMPLGQLADIPLPPTPPPVDVVLDAEGEYPDLTDIGFPSLDDEVACVMSRPLSVTVCDVPLPPSPPPADAEHHHLNEKTYPDLPCFFTPIDDKVPDLMPLGHPADIPLPHWVSFSA